MLNWMFALSDTRIYFWLNQNPTLSYYTQYTPSELRGCVRVLHRLFCVGPGSNLPAVREKYSQYKVSVVNLTVNIYLFVLWYWCHSHVSVQICSQEVLPPINPWWVLPGCNHLKIQISSSYSLKPCCCPTSETNLYRLLCMQGIRWPCV
jgi:hypothetical protein